MNCSLASVIPKKQSVLGKGYFWLNTHIYLFFPPPWNNPLKWQERSKTGKVKKDKENGRVKDNEREMLTKFWTWTSAEFDRGIVNVWKEDDRENRWYSHPPQTPWKTLNIRGTASWLAVVTVIRCGDHKPQPHTVTFCYSHLWRSVGWLLCLWVSWGFSQAGAWPGLPSGGQLCSRSRTSFPQGQGASTPVPHSQWGQRNGNTNENF